ncbi:MAG: GtrA family protein [Ruminococcus sp.]|nr:GtrA family protein [Ruminococcus sp.]
MKKIIRACVSILPKPLQELYYKYEDKWLYLFFGVLTTVVSFVTAGISKALLEKAGCSAVTVGNVSTVISWICAVTFAYLTNRVWVFDSEAKGAKALVVEAASFYGGRLATLGVEWVMMTVGYGLIGVNYWVMKIIANIVVLILNYVISKIFVFRNKKTGDTAAQEKAENE